MERGFSAQAVTVQSNQGWQSTGITVDGSIGVTVAYQTGQWEVDADDDDDVPYDANGSQMLDAIDGAPLPNKALGALVGRIGTSGQPFWVGDGPTTLPKGQSGMLQLATNTDLSKDLSSNVGNVTVFIYPETTVPDLSTPLVTEPPQSTPGVPTESLGPLAYLIGTWTNQPLGSSGKGGTDSPFSYNVMPLPQADPSAPPGYILKNFSYYEELTFTAIHGPVLNRNGNGAQVAYTLFYEQRVYFAEGPKKDALVHAENGSMLLLGDQNQPLGPYGNGFLHGVGNQTVLGSIVPNQSFNVAKQLSVPHGNSILALGSYTTGSGAPVIPPATVLPSADIDPFPYTWKNEPTNPQPSYTANPNQALTDALAIRAPTNFIALTVSSANGSGAVSNIGFEQKYSNVTRYDFTCWLESFDGGSSFPQLQYSQTITLLLQIKNGLVSFPHVTTNTLTKKSS
ncbi:heme-binding protein [Trinickia sp. Y13]|uniref:heme-binding protein n=1 Tax=Trinickia sp. Y13 TaxID=2917807 RepID=UPI00240725DF|nr:heme-binding protein [Trinickia sp. Y13]MDG0024968.1 heme-binding protein [Trinickia sp. Y13]